MAEPRLVLCTAPKVEAPGLARALVEERLAACVNVIPSLTSVYLWKGEICEDAESLLVIKTTDEAVGLLSERLVALHSYEVPEVVSLAVEAAEGNAAYLTWLAGCVAPEPASDE